MSSAMTWADLSSCAERVNAPLSDDPTVQVQGPVWTSSPLFNYIFYHWIVSPVSNAIEHRIYVYTTVSRCWCKTFLKSYITIIINYCAEFLLFFTLLRVNVWLKVVSVGGM